MQTSAIVRGVALSGSNGADLHQHPERMCECMCEYMCVCICRRVNVRVLPDAARTQTPTTQQVRGGQL
jgi:hypothetical protein